MPVMPGPADVPHEAGRLPLTGRRVCLRPVTDADTEYVFTLLVRLGIASVPRLDRFASAYAGDGTHFIVHDRRDGGHAGYTSLHSAGPGGRHIELGVLADPDSAIKAAGAEALFLTADYAFSSLPIRKLYIRTTEASAAHLGGALAAMSKREGTLREHLFFRGRYWDVYVTAICRADWNRMGRPIVERISARG